jgi:hypothetical protein
MLMVKGFLQVIFWLTMALAMASVAPGRQAAWIFD